MHNDFEKYLQHFEPDGPSGDLRRKVLASSGQAWKSRRAPVSSFARFVLWSQALAAAAAVALIVVENSRTDAFFASAHQDKENGADPVMMELCRDLGMGEARCRLMASAWKLRRVNGTKPVDFASYRQRINKVMEEGTIQ